MVVLRTRLFRVGYVGAGDPPWNPGTLENCRPLYDNRVRLRPSHHHISSPEGHRSFLVDLLALCDLGGYRLGDCELLLWLVSGCGLSALSADFSGSWEELLTNSTEDLVSHA